MLKRKKTSKRKSRNLIYIVVALCVFIGMMAVYVYLNFFGEASADGLKITQYQRSYVNTMEIEGGDYLWTWQVSIKIANRGNNSVSGAELVVELREELRTIDSQSLIFNLQAGRETTEFVFIQAKESEFIDKRVGCIVTIYLDGRVLDQYNTSWGDVL